MRALDGSLLHMHLACAEIAVEAFSLHQHAASCRLARPVATVRRLCSIRQLCKLVDGGRYAPLEVDVLL